MAARGAGAVGRDDGTDGRADEMTGANGTEAATGPWMGGAQAPRVADWGEIAGPAVIFGGPCSNLQATRAVLAEATRRGAAAICTGDLAAYCGQPAETAAAVRASGVRVVAGNMEQALAAGGADCGCGFDEGAACAAMAGAWFAHADRQVGAEARTWMAGLPDMAVFRHEGRRWAAIHGAGTAANRFLWATTTEAELAAEWAAVEAAAGPVDAIVSGHSGIGWLREVAGRLWLNAGAIGLPPNDGDPRVEFAVLDADGPRLERLGYDHAAAAAAMRAAGLVQGYDRCLETGWWPSEDMLPPELRRAGGEAAA